MVVRKALRIAFATTLGIGSAFGPAIAQDVTTGQGPALKFHLGYEIYLNAESSLVQSWTVINDPNLPVSISPEKFGGLKLEYEQRYSYKMEVPLKVEEKISAIEINVVTIDVWGEVQHRLSTTEIIDIAPGERVLEAVWDVRSENEAKSVLNIVAFVERVRLEDGTVLEADQAAVLKEVQKIRSTITSDDIAPSADEE